MSETLEEWYVRWCLQECAPQKKKIMRNLDTEENRAFWQRVEDASREVASWPWWKRGAPAPRCIRCNENPVQTEHATCDDCNKEDEQ